MQNKKFLLFCLLFSILFFSCSEQEQLYKITIKHGKQCGFINYEGKMIIPAEYSYVYNFTENWACVEKNNQSIYIDRNNKVVLIPEVKNSMPFSEGYAVASEGLKYGFINKKGRVVIPLIYDAARSFKNGVAWIYKDKKWLCINKKNEILFSDNYDEVYDFNRSYAVVVNKLGEKKIINKKNEVINLPVGFNIYQNNVDDNCNILLTNNESIFVYNLNTKELKEKQERFLVLYDESNQKYGLKDTTGKVLIQPLYDYLSEPDDKGFVLCGIGDDWDDMKFGYLSIQGEILIPIEFYQLDFFQNDMAVFQPRSIDGGYIRRDGKVFYAKDYL